MKIAIIFLMLALVSCSGSDPQNPAVNEPDPDYTPPIWDQYQAQNINLISLTETTGTNMVTTPPIIHSTIASVLLDGGCHISYDISKYVPPDTDLTAWLAEPIEVTYNADNPAYNCTSVHYSGVYCSWGNVRVEAQVAKADFSCTVPTTP